MTQSRNLEEFNGLNKGKPCVILGSGCSLRDCDLSDLSEYTTISVNSGYLAYPNSDFFISDDWAVAHWSYFFDDLKKSDHTTALLYDKKLGNYSEVFGDRSVLFKHRKGTRLTDVYSHSEKANHIWEARSSSGSAIHVAHIMGCNPIVLLGMDCSRVSTYRYFWQFPDFKPKPYRNDGVAIDRFPRCKVKNVDSDADLRSILRYWSSLGSIVAKQCPDLKILNASPNSLIEAFPKVNFNTWRSNE